MRTVLVAEESAGVQALRLVRAREHEVVAVLTGSDSGGPGATVAGLAGSLGLEVVDAGRVRDPQFAAWLRDRRVDLLLNVHSLHVAAPQVVAAPRIGAYNLHPGPLPEYAGLNVVSWAVYHGEARHGVTLHRMEPEVDRGAIAFDDRFDIGPRDSALAVFMSCVRRGMALLDRLLDAAESAAVPARAQARATFRCFPAGPPEEGRLRWDRPARRVVDFVRACDYLPFPSPWGHPHCADVGILKASASGEPAAAAPGTVGPPRDGRVPVAAADEWVLVDLVERGGERRPATAALVEGERLA